MAWTKTIAYTLATCSLWLPTNADNVWPNEATDELEKMLFEQQNPFESSLATFAVPCSASGLAIGRGFGAEWIRNAYHDMATADVQAGTGGIDASIVFEKDRPENPGAGFQETLDFFRPRYTTRSSLADLFAMGAVFGVGGCSNGNIILPYRAGRVDATGPGPSGVPEPQEDLATHTAKFVRQGFNTTEMIALVACGHTVGGVHGVDFPEIVPNPQPPPVTGPFGNDNTVFFDTTTSNFDNQVAKEFVANISQNPLAFGHNETTRSDFRIFNADGGDMISQMAESLDFFSQTCATLLERMINTVPPSVKLTDVLQPLPVKPRKWSIDVNADKTLTVSLTLRIVDTLLGGGIQALVKPVSRTGAVLPATSPVVIGNISTSTCDYPNCGPSFVYLDYNINIPAEQGISSFTVDITDGSGMTTTYNNGGAGFPLSDAVQPQMSLSTQTTKTVNGVTLQQLNVTAAVYNADQYTNISLIVPQPSNFSATISPWVAEVAPMKASGKIAGTNYTLYTGSWLASNESAPQHPFDVLATGPKGSASSTFNSWGDVPFVL
ncbi:WSC domain-containing protein [Trichoderma lentiforme]|uniref:Peroxidase n=1 Tax=Trichoderma lentiforme TaxID=1567552 RepID=A0A9P4XCH0_9HYPO|nr:WSC domain-containing protein [Trichoderma lentiforme]